jgi:hypothetical protein
VSYKHKNTEELIAVDFSNPTLHGMPEMPEPLVEFTKRIQDIFPLCSFAHNKEDYDGTGVRALYVYHKHKPLTMGWIGFGGWTSSARSNSYVVCARSIENRRCNSYNLQYFTKSSENIDTATQSAKRFLRDGSPVELANIDVGTTQNHWNRSVREIQDHVYEKRRSLVQHDRYRSGQRPSKDFLLAELQLLVNQGYKFAHAEFNAQAIDLVNENKAAMEALHSRSTRITMVSIESSPTTGNSLFIVAATEDILAAPPLWVAKGTFVEDTLDVDIAGKLAVLSMCDVDHWVDNVGYKVTGNRFYVTW